MRNRTDVLGSGEAAYPEPLLPGGFEAGIVTLAFGAQGVHGFECDAGAINGKPIIVWERDVFGAAAILLAIVVTGMVTGASGIILGALEGAAKLLAAASAGTVFTGFVHGKTGLTDDIAGGQRFRLLCSAWIERDHAIATVYGFHSIVDCLGVVAFIADEGAFMQWQKGIGLG